MFEVAGFIVSGAILPTPKEDARPLESESPEGGLVGRTPLSVALVEFTGPEGAREGCQEARGVDSGCAREAEEDLVAILPGSGRSRSLQAPGASAVDAIWTARLFKSGSAFFASGLVRFCPSSA